MWRSEKSLLSLIEYRASHSPKNWTAQTPDFGNPANNPNSSFSLIINEKTWILAVIEGSGANYGTHLNVGHFMSHRMKEEMKGHTDKLTEAELKGLIRQPQYIEEGGESYAALTVVQIEFTGENESAANFEIASTGGCKCEFYEKKTGQIYRSSQVNTFNVSKKSHKAHEGTTYIKYDITNLHHLIMVLAGQKFWELGIPITFGKDACTITWELASEYFIRTQTDLPLIYADFYPLSPSADRFVVRFQAHERDKKPGIEDNPHVQHYMNQFLHLFKNAGYSFEFADSSRIARDCEDLFCHCDGHAILLFTKLLYSEFVKCSIEICEDERAKSPYGSYAPIFKATQKEFSDLFKWTSTMSFSNGFEIRDFATQFQQLDETFEFEVDATSIKVKSTLPANICKFNEFVPSDMTVNATLQPSIFEYWQIFNIDPGIRDEILKIRKEVTIGPPRDVSHENGWSFNSFEPLSPFVKFKRNRVYEDDYGNRYVANSEITNFYRDGQFVWCHDAKHNKILPEQPQANGIPLEKTKLTQPDYKAQETALNDICQGKISVRFGIPLYFDDWESIPYDYGDQKELTLCIIKDKVCISGITFEKDEGDDSSYYICTSTRSEWKRKGLNILAISLTIIACHHLGIKTILSIPSNALTPYTQNSYFNIECLQSDGLKWVQRKTSGRRLNVPTPIKEKIERQETLTPEDWEGIGITSFNIENRIIFKGKSYVCISRKKLDLDAKAKSLGVTNGNELSKDHWEQIIEDEDFVVSLSVSENIEKARELVTEKIESITLD